MFIDEDKSLISLQSKVLHMVLVLLWIALIYIVTRILGQFSEITVSFAIAFFVNYLLSRPVSLLTKFIRFRVLSILIIYLLFASLIGTAIYYLTPAIAGQIKSLQTGLPSLIDKLDTIVLQTNKFLNTNYQINLSVPQIDKEHILNQVIELITKLNFSDLSTTATAVLSNSFTVIVYFFMTLILSFYLLADGQRAWDLFTIPFSDKLARHLNAIKRKIDNCLYAYIVGQFQIATLTSLVMLVCYVILQVPYALLLALLQMLEVVPLLGTWAAIIPSISIVLITNGPRDALIALAIYLIYSQIIRDNFVAPKIMGHALGFHPLGIMLAIIIGAKVGGLIGIIFALPILATISAVIDYNIELARLKVSMRNED
jgi:predicted PurR-regulated permease PerM